MSLFLSRKRSDLTENIDDMRCDPSRLQKTYLHLRRVNLMMRIGRTIYARYLRPLALGVDKRISVLDVGCGAGDLLGQWSRLLQNDGIEAELTGIDPDPRAIEFANRHCVATNVRFECVTLPELESRGRRYDFVVSCHVLHHLQEDRVGEFLRSADALSTHESYHLDIRRSTFAYVLFSLVAPVAFPGSYVVSDGLTSVRRSYTPNELKAVVPPRWTVSSVSPYHLVCQRPSNDQLVVTKSAGRLARV